MMYSNYSLTKSTYKDVPFYGIRIKTSSGKVYSYDFITPCETDMDKLLDRMSQADISENHYRDIVRDFITELYYRTIDDNGLAE